MKKTTKASTARKPKRVGHPTHDYIWLEPMRGDEMESKDLGNGLKLFMPTANEAGDNGGNRKAGRGRVIDVGPGVFTDAGHRKPMCCEVGDIVYYFHEPFTIVARGRQVHVLQDYKVIWAEPGLHSQASLCNEAQERTDAMSATNDIGAKVTVLNDAWELDFRAVVQGMAAHGYFPLRAQVDGIDDALNTAAIVAGYMQTKRERRYRMLAQDAADEAAKR